MEGGGFEILKLSISRRHATYATYLNWLHKVAHKQFCTLYKFAFVNILVYEMSELISSRLYKPGVDEELDRKLSRYRKLRIWHGEAYTNSLTENEVDIMVKLWRKEKRTPWKLLTSEVETFMVS